ncbi:hypothetical protein [Qipengyuania marisflavi]|uniref:Lipoprotein n=1 Tax=Qipengyuania marisflavi TaxID=2486356 RepID=A0A5S3P756_9SPHN|nr:hypothetical protein [Qipengyuania marisflavi]TMM48975.1 hypothetical protein FEV51_06250 [Qipengyuania marisflavi]
MKLRFAACIAPIVLLAACGDKADDTGTDEAMDPASEQALNADLMTDPDMAGSNEAGAALSGGGNGAIPKIDSSPRAIEAARSRAVELVGGVDSLRPAPAPRTLAADAPDSPAMIRAAQTAVTPGGANCADDVTYTSAWAAKLPGAFPVYPRGNTQEAAGTDKGDCALRIVTFRTPVALDDVMAFYNTRAKTAGYSVEHVKKGGDNVLSGVKGDSAYVVYSRTLSGGVTEVDLVTTD